MQQCKLFAVHCRIGAWMRACGVSGQFIRVLYYLTYSTRSVGYFLKNGDDYKGTLQVLLIKGIVVSSMGRHLARLTMTIDRRLLIGRDCYCSRYMVAKRTNSAMIGARDATSRMPRSGLSGVMIVCCGM